MDLITAVCLAFLIGLMLGALLGIGSIALCMTAKKADNGLAHESDAAPYPRYYE